MKTSKHCPKCGSDNIIKVKYSHNSKIFTGFLEQVKIAKYVCIKCGYIEEWIEKQSDLVKIGDEYSE